MAIRYQPVTETITPPISPARAHAVDRKLDQDTPFTDSENRKKPGPRHVVRPSENRPLEWAHVAELDKQSWNR